MKKRIIVLMFIILPCIVAVIILIPFVFVRKYSKQVVFEKMERLNAIVLEDQEHFAVIPQKDGNRDAAIFVYPEDDQNEIFVWNSQPYPNLDCRVLYQNKLFKWPEEGDLIYFICLQHHEKDIFLFLFSTMNQADRYSVANSEGKVMGTVEKDHPDPNHSAYIFFVQDAAEAPTFFLNDVEYQIIDRKIVKT